MEARQQVAAVARRRGLRVHDETEALRTAESLGIEIGGSGPTLDQLSDRYWGVDGTLDHLLEGGRLTGRDVERATGHFVS